MREVDYKSWAKYLLMLMKLAGKKWRRSEIFGEKLCDYACGTGNISFIMSRLGYDVTGIDGSREMLQAAEAKLARKKKDKPLFIHHDMTTYSLPGAFDRAICVYDSINYLSNVDAVSRFFLSVHANLKAGGVFVFDASMESNSLSNDSLFVQHGEYNGIHYHRQSKYDPRKKIHTTFVRVKDRDMVFEETHREYVYPLEVLRRLFMDAGFEERFAAGDFTMLEADDRSERVHFVLLKGDND